MSVCVCVCVCACMSVCTCVCTYVCVSASICSIDGWMCEFFWGGSLRVSLRMCEFMC
jgi:hypothetical protein